MPFRSRAQSRLAHAVANDPSLAEKTGMPVKVAQEFIAAQHGHSEAHLPDHVEKKGSGGTISVPPRPRFRW